MMSSFAREKLSLHLRRRMGVFVSRVKATELMANLPCLTPSDREEIQAKKDFSGNYAAMQLLLDYVQKRMNWPEELISALEVLEHQDLADELRAEWTKNNPSPPSTVVRVHVHPAPLPSQESSEWSPSSLVLPAQPAPLEVALPPVVAPPEASPPPEVAPEALPPPVVAAQPEAPPSSVSEAPMAVSSSEPAPQAPKAAVSPEIASEVAPSAVAASQAEPQAAPSSVSAEEPTMISEPPVSHSEEAASPQPGPMETVNLEDNSSHSNAPTQMALSKTNETTPMLPVSDLYLSQTESTPTPAALATVQSPERRPVQDTSPPTAKVTTFHQEAVEDSDPAQVTEDDQHTEPPQSPPRQHSSPAMAPASPPVDTSMDDMCLSKPGVLLSNNMDSQPYSGDSTRLQRSLLDSGPAAADVSSPVVVPDPVTTATPLPCQENGVPEEITELLSHNEPQEDTYESSCLSSLGDQEVLFNVVHVSEDASIQNQDGQTQSMLGNKDVSVSETTQPVQNHNSQSQITALSGSTDLDLSSGPNQHGQTEDSLGKAASKCEESQGVIMSVNGQDTSPSTKPSDPPAPTGSVPIISGSSSAENHNLLEPVEAEVMIKATMEAGVVPELKQEGVRGGGSHYLLGAAVVVVSALFVAWRMKN